MEHVRLVLQLLNIQLHRLLRHNLVLRELYILRGHLYQSWYLLESKLRRSLKLLRSPLLRNWLRLLLLLAFDHRYRICS